MLEKQKWSVDSWKRENGGGRRNIQRAKKKKTIFFPLLGPRWENKGGYVFSCSCSS